MSDTDQAWMRHPDLTDHEPTPVVRSQIPILAGSGWYEVEAPPPPVLPDDEDTHAPAHPKKTTRRRRPPATSEDPR